jgi:hypothetical protein
MLTHAGGEEAIAWLKLFENDKSLALACSRQQAEQTVPAYAAASQVLHS